MLTDIELSEDEVVSAIRNRHQNKAQGPDGIPGRLLIETSYQIAPSLCLLYNKSLHLGILPSEWKLANVVPIHKRCEKSYVENYRPISLLPLISKAQHGFVPGKSCVTQLIEVFEQIGHKLDKGEQIDVICIDMSKAFDKVSQSQLVDRLHDFGFRGNILKWFLSYLSNPYQQTMVLGATSRRLGVTSGVPQGSILGPLLFLQYENHLANNVTNSSVATFSDDAKIFKVIRSISDVASLQQDLSHFESGSSDANLHLNAEKCKLL